MSCPSDVATVVFRVCVYEMCDEGDVSACKMCVCCVYGMCKACGVLSCHVRMVCIVFISEMGGGGSGIYGSKVYRRELHGWFTRLR